MSLRVILPVLLLAAALAAPSARAGDAPTLSVSIDHAKVLKVERAAETIIIGNPSIVDVSIHDARTLILTGRSYGVTNLVVLDGDGQPILDEGVVVNSVETASVRVYRQASRSSYSCSPNCEPTVTIGDMGDSFSSAAGQFQTRESLARPASQ